LQLFGKYDAFIVSSQYNDNLGKREGISMSIWSLARNSGVQRQRNLSAHALIVALLSRTATKGAPRTSRAARGKLNPLINYP
jgi:hypothetical protein